MRSTNIIKGQSQIQNRDSDIVSRNARSKIKNVTRHLDSKITEFRHKLLALIEYRLSVYFRLWPILLILGICPIFGVIAWIGGKNPTEFVNWPPIELTAGAYVSKEW